MSGKISRKESSDEEVFYIISVASRLSGMHPQTLRQYDRLGLVSPSRASGRGRRYSSEDIELLLMIQALVNDGINLAGVKKIMELQLAVQHLMAELEKFQ